jgi:hypothetical protein
VRRVSVGLAGPTESRASRAVFTGRKAPPLSFQFGGARPNADSPPHWPLRRPCGRRRPPHRRFCRPHDQAPRRSSPPLFARWPRCRLPRTPRRLPRGRRPKTFRVRSFASRRPLRDRPRRRARQSEISPELQCSDQDAEKRPCPERAALPLAPWSAKAFPLAAILSGRRDGIVIGELCAFEGHVPEARAIQVRLAWAGVARRPRTRPDPGPAERAERRG